MINCLSISGLHLDMSYMGKKRWKCNITLPNYSKEPTGSVRRYEVVEDISALDPDLEILGPLVGKVQLMRTNSGILVTGTLSTAVRSTCNRCLEPIAVSVRFELTEHFRPLTEVETVAIYGLMNMRATPTIWKMRRC